MAFVGCPPRYYEHRPLNLKEREVDNASAILRLIKPRFRSMAEARLWFEQQQIPGFNGRTARQLVEEGRAREVREFILAVDSGVYS